MALSGRIPDETVAFPSTITNTMKTETMMVPFEERVSSILKFVDTKLLDSSSRMETTSILDRVRREHREDFDTARGSCLEIERPRTGNPRSSLPFETIAHLPYPEGAPQSFLPPNLAIRSTEPVLDASSVDAVREAAEEVWEAGRNDDAGTSRFTYQYSGNSEAHVFDFITNRANSNPVCKFACVETAGKRAITVLNNALQQKIYPMIREAFFQWTSSNKKDHEDEGTRLFVYDALVIRYNSTKAAEGGAEASGEVFASAGQPLHRDLGLVSVNIMLNSPESFEGGGTFFENQLLQPKSTSAIQPMKPSGAGYCLAHSASERHAGAGTTSGVRDILVLFVSAATGMEDDDSCSTMNDAFGAPAELVSARLKNCRSFCEGKCFDGQALDTEQQWRDAQRASLRCRILHQRTAVMAGCEGHSSGSLLSPSPHVYFDGEALQYLGTALMEYSGFISDPSEAIGVLEVASECFEVAALVTPCDSRVYNNLGIVLGMINQMKTNHGIETSTDDGAFAQRERAQEAAYRRGLDILQRSIRAGCTNESITRDLESLSLNYGLFVANQDRFCDATEILEPVAKSVGTAGGTSAAAATDAGKDAYRLWKYCSAGCLDSRSQELTQ